MNIVHKRLFTLISPLLTPKKASNPGSLTERQKSNEMNLSRSRSHHQVPRRRCGDVVGKSGAIFNAATNAVTSLFFKMQVAAWSDRRRRSTRSWSKVLYTLSNARRDLDIYPRPNLWEQIWPKLSRSGKGMFTHCQGGFWSGKKIISTERMFTVCCAGGSGHSK